MNINSATTTVDTLCALLQEAHFTARDLQQHVPMTERESLADQLHRIRTLATRLRTQLAETEDA
jgi:hypothetical protein